MTRQLSTSESLVTVLVGRFEPLVLRGLLETLRDDARVHVIAANLAGAALEGAVERCHPRLVIIDDDVEHSVLLKVIASRVAPGVLVLASGQPMLYRSWLHSTGARCVARELTAGQLISEICLAARATSDDGVGALPLPLGSHPLTDAEMNLLDHLSRGRSYAQIALETRLSESTIKTHSANLRRKLGVKDKQQLVGVQVPPRR